MINIEDIIPFCKHDYRNAVRIQDKRRKWGFWYDVQCSKCGKWKNKLFDTETALKEGYAFIDDKTVQEMIEQKYLENKIEKMKEVLEKCKNLFRDSLKTETYRPHFFESIIEDIDEVLK